MRSAPWSTRRHHALVAALAVAALVVGCAKGSSGPSASDDASTTSSAPAEDFVAEAEDFVNLADMTQVRGLFISNPLGYLDEALAVANSPEGGSYPVGTIVQLIPQEAMVKRAPGFDPGSNDWEFFELETSETGTVIANRGGAEIESRFGVGSCASCHAQAEPQFDFICEDTHGCDPLPVGDDLIEGLQVSDPRPRL